MRRLKCALGLQNTVWEHPWLWKRVFQVHCPYLIPLFLWFYIWEVVSLQRELMHLEGESYVHETYGSQNRYDYGRKPVNWTHDLYLYSPMGCDTSKDVINTFLAWQSWYSDPRCPSGHSDLVKVERVGNKNEEWGHNLYSPKKDSVCSAGKAVFVYWV